EYGLASFLLTADIETAREHALVAAGAPLDATVLKVAHHGSRSSTTAPWLRAVRPSVAVISVGARNPYGHPDAGVLARLADAGVRRHPGAPRRRGRDGARRVLPRLWPRRVLRVPHRADREARLRRARRAGRPRRDLRERRDQERQRQHPGDLRRRLRGRADRS